MNGPEHYREAEQILASVAPRDHADGSYSETYGPETVARIQRAQAHATLALAAATIDAPGYSHEVRKETAWHEVTL